MTPPLALAAVLSLAAQCAPGLDGNLIAGIAKHESGFNPVVLHDNTTSRSYTPETVPEAIALAASLIHAQGHSVDLGLMQINSRNLDYLGLRESDAFDACHSIRAAATLFRAISYYNTGSPTRGFANGYTPATIASIQQVRGVPGLPVIPAIPTPKLPVAPPAGAHVLHPTSGRLISFGG